MSHKRHISRVAFEYFCSPKGFIFSQPSDTPLPYIASRYNRNSPSRGCFCFITILSKAPGHLRMNGPGLQTVLLVDLGYDQTRAASWRGRCRILLRHLGGTQWRLITDRLIVSHAASTPNATTATPHSF